MFEGLGVENHEIGIWLNLHENHVDNERITSIQQVAAAKALVITQANDLAILNAGDPFCMRVVPKVKAKKIRPCRVFPLKSNCFTRQERPVSWLAHR